MTPLPYPVIDVTSRRQTLDELTVPLEDRRASARSGGELWAAIILTALSPFQGVEAYCTTVLVLNSTTDSKITEFADLAKLQSPSKAVKVIELVGSETDAAMQAHRLGFSSGPNVVEVAVRMVDRLARAYATGSEGDSGWQC